MRQEKSRPSGNWAADDPQQDRHQPNTSNGLCVPDIDPDADTLSAALAYVEAGWYMLPVKRGSKHPGSVVGDKWQIQSSRDPKQLAAWFAGTDHGIALHCGRSGAVVFDVDYPSLVPDVLAKHLASALFQSTRERELSRGHYVFAQPPGRTIGNGWGRLGKAWGEVRGLNGVIIAAPTPHPEGGLYRWVRTGAVPMLPDELAEQLDDASPAEDAASDAEVAAFVGEHHRAERPEVLHGWVKALSNGCAERSRHLTAVSVVAGAMKEARAGYFPAPVALDTLKPIFVTAATRSPTGGERHRSEREALAEWKGFVAWGVGQALAADLDAVRARTEEKMPNNVEWVDNIAAAPATAHRGQARMAYRVAERYEGEIVHVTGLGWHRWDGTRWAPDDRGAAKRAVLAELRHALADSLDDKELRADVRKCESASGVAGVLDLAAALKPFAAAVRDLDADPYLLNTANGTLDLRTCESRPHAPADRITKVCRGAYSPEAESRPWDAFLARVLPDGDVREFVQRLVGLGLLGEVREHKLPILTGVGANGKSVFDKAIRYSLGDYACTAEPDLFMHREGAHPTGEMDLRGVRWVVVSECEKGRRLAEATMKRLTGGDTIRARRMRQDFVEFTPSHTPLLITNHLPKVSGDDPAIWRRLRVVPFDVVIPEAEQDCELDARLQLEADGILAWAVAGYRNYLKHGLDEPASVRKATDTYHRESDAVARFIDERCLTASPALKATTGQLFESWEVWRQTDGAEPMSSKAFGLALGRLGFPAAAAVNGKRWRAGIAVKAVVDED
jgi:putative DNA primase/helicase